MTRPSFRRLKFGLGYHQGETDAFVERLLATANGSADGRPVTRAELGELALRPALVGDRYSIEEVDRFIKGAAAWLPEHAPVAERPQGELQRPSFTTGRFREGYDPQDVDAFVDRVFAALDGGEALTSADIRGISFTPVRFREGYDVAEVDAFLDLAEGWFAAPR